MRETNGFDGFYRNGNSVDGDFEMSSFPMYDGLPRRRPRPSIFAFRRPWKAIVLFLMMPSSVYADDPYAPVEPFLNRYCVRCHCETTQKGEVRLDDFDAIDGSLWSDVYDQIHFANMPPEDEIQPSKADRRRVAALVLAISRDDAFSIATGYRRLNRREYGNTVRDLLGLKPGVYDPAASIFQDDVEDGFDTNAHELIISNELLLEYLDSAERSLRMALFLEDLKPPHDGSCCV